MAWINQQTNDQKKMSVYEDLGYGVQIEEPNQIQESAPPISDRDGLADYDLLINYLIKRRDTAIQYYVFGNRAAASELRQNLLKAEAYSKAIRAETFTR